jgi:hypothetical protein
MRHVSELTHVLIYHAKTKRHVLHVLFFATCDMVHSDFQIKCDSLKLLAYMKTKIKHTLDSCYEFDTGRAPESISRNASRAQALLAEKTFIYRVYLILPQLWPTERRHIGL